MISHYSLSCMDWELLVSTAIHRPGDVSAVPLAYRGFMFVCISGDHQSFKTLNETLE